MKIRNKLLPAQRSPTDLYLNRFLVSNRGRNVSNIPHNFWIFEMDELDVLIAQDHQVSSVFLQDAYHLGHLDPGSIETDVGILRWISHLTKFSR